MNEEKKFWRKLGQVLAYILMVYGLIGLALSSPILAGDAQAKKVAVDASGNVYVTGSSYNGSNYDYVTIKYNSSGAWVWGRRYNGPANGEDEPTGLAVDAGGNVYVTGYSWGGVSDYDYVTIKYDTNGTWLWGRRYGGAYGGEDHAAAITVDSQGNVYVTGASENMDIENTVSLDYVTIKYDSNGTLVWGHRYNGKGGQDDKATALAVDNGGNIYVTGVSHGGSSSYDDYVTIKYSPSGAWVWGQRYNGPANDSDKATALAVDSSGNVCVTGKSANGFNDDYVTIKYSPSGAWVWGQRYNGPGNDDDEAVALAVDSGGNVCVTGTSWMSSLNPDYVTIKYDASGYWLWGQRYNGYGLYQYPDEAKALAVDANGNVIVTGTSYGDNSTVYDYVTIKYDAGGAYVWGRRYGGNGSDHAEDLALDANGNVFVTGYSWGGVSGLDYLTIMYEFNGIWVWGQRYESPY